MELRKSHVFLRRIDFRKVLRGLWMLTLNTHSSEREGRLQPRAGALADPITQDWSGRKLSHCPEEEKCLSQGFAADFGLLGLKFSRQRLKNSTVEVRYGQPFPSSWVSWMPFGLCLNCAD